MLGKVGGPFPTLVWPLPAPMAAPLQRALNGSDLSLSRRHFGPPCPAGVYKCNNDYDKYNKAYNKHNKAYNNYTKAYKLNPLRSNAIARCVPTQQQL